LGVGDDVGQDPADQTPELLSVVESHHEDVHKTTNRHHSPNPLLMPLTSQCAHNLQAHLPIVLLAHARHHHLQILPIFLTHELLKRFLFLCHFTQTPKTLGHPLHNSLKHTLQAHLPLHHVINHHPHILPLFDLPYRLRIPKCPISRHHHRNRPYLLILTPKIPLQLHLKFRDDLQRVLELLKLVHSQHTEKLEEGVWVVAVVLYVQGVARATVVRDGLEVQRW
jgi:hypothetical protein